MTGRSCFEVLREVEVRIASFVQCEESLYSIIYHFTMGQHQMLELLFIYLFCHVLAKKLKKDNKSHCVLKHAFAGLMGDVENSLCCFSYTIS